jgi:hypothetical protein
VNLSDQPFEVISVELKTRERGRPSQS